MPIRRSLAPICAALAVCAGGLSTMGSTAYAGVVNWNDPSFSIVPPPWLSSYGTGAAQGYGLQTNGWIVRLEEEALHISDQQFREDCRKGWSLHQIADSRGVTRAQFYAYLRWAEKADLDQRVSEHQCSQGQENWAMSNWTPGWDSGRPDTAVFRFGNE